jgi:hypothetical protein
VSTHLLRALAALAVASAPAAAPALGVSGRAGLLYTRFDSMPPDGPSATMPRLDVDLALDARGAIVSPDFVRWSLGAGWGRNSYDVPGGERTTRLSYSGSATVLHNQTSPVGLSLSATRGETDFATNASPDAFGSGLSSSAGGSLYFRSGTLPKLDASYNWNESQTRIAGQPLRLTTAHAVSSSLQMSAPTLSLVARYRGEFRDGSWQFDRAQLHSAALNAQAFVGNQVITFTGGSDLSLPDVRVPGAIEQQTTAFEAAIDARHALRRSFRYRYGHTLLDSPGFPTEELERQSLIYEGDHLLTAKHLFTRWLVDLSYGATRSDDVELISTGETLGVTLHWQRPGKVTSLSASVGPRVSLIQTEESESGGYGGAAGVRVGRPFGVHTLTLDWNGSYGQDLYAQAGWTLRQSFGATLSGPASRARYNAVVRATAFRSYSPVTGDGAGRTVSASGSITTSRLSLDLRAHLSNGIVGAGREQFAGDGLLIPAPFDTTEIDVSLGGGARLYTGLSARLDFHLGRSEIPNRPVLHEAAAVASLRYTYARFGMALENRVSRVEVADGWNTTNQAMFRVFRSFAW